MIIQIKSDSKNNTLQVLNALEDLKASGGGELHFEKGEYHFYKKGSKKEFYAVSNSFEGTLSSKSPAQAVCDSVEVCFPENSQGTYFAEFSDEGNKRESLFFKEKLEQKNHYEVFLGSNCAKVSVSTVVEGDRKLLVIKDSFANCMIPMLTPYFSKIVVVAPRYMTEGIDGIMKEEVFTDILFLYNANTFFDDTVLTDVLGY